MLSCIRITSELLQSQNRIEEVYMSSFDEYERLSISYITHKTKNKDIDFLAFYDDELFVGLAYTININNKLCILYFAIDESYRSKGYGSRALEKIKEINENKIIFLTIREVDKKYHDYITRNRRLNFYQKNGFARNDFTTDEQGHFYLKENL